MKPITDLVLWGATGQALVIAELLIDTKFCLRLFVDREIKESPIVGIPLVSGELELDAWLAAREHFPVAAYAAIGGSRGRDRREVQNLLLSKGLSAQPLVHRTAFVAANAIVGIGSQILAHAKLCAAASVGCSVILNTGASVDHECRLDDGVHIGPGAVLAGSVIVETDAFIGAGAVILPRLRIGERATIGAGAVVTHDVPKDAIVYGNPARLVSKRQAWTATG